MPVSALADGSRAAGARARGGGSRPAGRCRRRGGGGRARRRLRRVARSARAAAVLRVRGLALSRTGQDAEALDVLRAGARRASPTTPRCSEALLRSEAAAAGVPAALARYDALPPRPGRPARGRPRPGAPAGPPRAARGRRAGPQRRAVRRRRAARPRRRPGRAAGAGPHRPADHDPRARRARQDPRRARPRPGGDPAAGALRRAGRHLARRTTWSPRSAPPWASATR